MGSIPGLAQWVKELAFLQMQCRSMHLGPAVAVAVVQAGSYSSASTPSQGTSMCPDAAVKRDRKKKKLKKKNKNPVPKLPGREGAGQEASSAHPLSRSSTHTPRAVQVSLLESAGDPAGKSLQGLGCSSVNIQHPGRRCQRASLHLQHRTFQNLPGTRLC